MFQRSEGEPRTFNIEHKTFYLPDFAEGMQELYANNAQILGVIRRNAGERTVVYRNVSSNAIEPPPTVLPEYTVNIAMWGSQEVVSFGLEITGDDGTTVFTGGPLAGSVLQVAGTTTLKNPKITAVEGYPLPTFAYYELATAPDGFMTLMVPIPLNPGDNNFYLRRLGG